MIRRAGPEDMEAVFAIRAKVFIEEQGVPEAEERDDYDADAIHLIAFADNIAVGTARLLVAGATGKIGRVAVLQSYRGRGLGQGLIKAALIEFQSLGLTHAKLGAQTHAIGFYEALGFEATGPEYMDAGIPHRDMIRAL